MIKDKRLATIVLALFITAAVFAFVGVSATAAQDPASGSDGVGDLTLNDVTDLVRDWLTIVGAIVSIAVVIGGGVLARRNAQIFRAKAPHVVISHEISHRPLGSSYVHIFVTAALHNSSRVHIEFLDGFASIQQVNPISDSDVEALHEQVFVDREVADLQWADLALLRHRWNQDGFLVEPGEIDTETFDFVVGRDVESVAVTTYFYNARVVGKIDDETDLARVKRRKRLFRRWLTSRGPLGWGRTSVYDIVRQG